MPNPAPARRVPDCWYTSNPCDDRPDVWYVWNMYDSTQPAKYFGSMEQAGLVADALNMRAAGVEVREVDGDE